MINRIRQTRIFREYGFTLTELAIVLVIVALLTGGLLISLSASRDIADNKETNDRLSQIRDTLIGYASAHGRLPCPAAPPPAGGTESASSIGACTYALSGFVPASLLGITPTDDHGYALDSWNNPIHYVVYPNAIAGQANPFTTPLSMKTLGMETISLSSLSPSPVSRTFLFVCASASGIDSNSCGTAQKLTDSAIAIIYSTGKNGANETNGGADDTVFVSPPSALGYDDLALWISPNTLFSRLIAAGRLP